MFCSMKYMVKNSNNARQKLSSSNIPFNLTISSQGFLNHVGCLCCQMHQINLTGNKHSGFFLRFLFDIFNNIFSIHYNDSKYYLQLYGVLMYTVGSMILCIWNKPFIAQTTPLFKKNRQGVLALILNCLPKPGHEGPDDVQQGLRRDGRLAALPDGYQGLPELLDQQATVKTCQVSYLQSYMWIYKIKSRKQ